MKTARTLTFLDETQELINIYDHNPDEDNPNPTPFKWPQLPTASQTLSQQPPLERTQSAPASAPVPPTQPSPVTQQDFARPSPASTQAFADNGFTWSLSNSHSPRAEKHSQPSESPASQAFSDRVADASEALAAKRRRLTFESSYHSSTTSDSPRNLVRSPSEGWHTGWTPNTSIDNVTSNADIDLAAYTGLETTVSNSLSRIYLDTPVWPLQDREEARLLRYFVENLSRNFDLTDPRRHFRSVVPQRAAICPTLMNAIFALSARHLSRVGEYDPLVSNKYHQECLKHLIPMLDDTDAILDENLLASTIILRHLEEFEVPISGQVPADQHSHLLGAQAFIAAQERAAVTGGLRQAAFWVGLRQEVYVAFVNQRPVLPALEHCNIDRSFDAAEDHIWACRMVVLCADTIRFCFSDHPQTIANYTYLTSQVSQWHTSKPLTFTPIYTHQPSNPYQIFPEIWFTGDEYATGIQHYHLARILLSSYNPSIPRLGPGRAAMLREMDSEIKHHVKILCGMARSNPANAPAFTYASMAVTMAGDKFSERFEQEALIDVLEECDRMHAWPTGMAVSNLKSAWGWADQGRDGNGE
ncbi:hypothetical protein HII31_13671 [Pseudocercospora fuligena]|uniref:Arca-like protein n=1 Tax=Pseudocercospora fuligena TaxID=685502 RepID=A0A8H6R5N5_9PEZI|nr:hypothetical protein HII31_13671 [Pseudocercospora fuligena]